MTSDSHPAHPGSPQFRVGEPHDLVRQYLAIYDSYHNHKEVMAYGVTALYLGGATALFVGNPFWQTYGRFDFALLICFLILLAGIAFWFVRHQLMLRRSAGDMFKACSRLAGKWLVVPPNAETLKPDETELDRILFRGFAWPRALVSEMQDVQRSKSKSWWARDLTYMALMGSGLLVLLRLFLTWKSTS